MLSQTEGEEEVNTSGTNKSAGTRERERERCSESPRRKERSDRGRVKLAYLPSGSAASQWRLTGKESNAPNRTHRGHRCARVHVCARVCEHVCMSEREKKMTDTDSEAGREKICVCVREQSSVGSTGKLVTSGQTDRLSGFRNKISRELTN